MGFEKDPAAPDQPVQEIDRVHFFSLPTPPPPLGRDRGSGSMQYPSLLDNGATIL